MPLHSVRNRLVYLPDWSRDNPYQKLLYGEIAKAGVPCCGMQGKDFSFAWLLGNVKNVKYIHLHWLFGVYDPQKKGLTFKLAIWFLLKLILARFLGYKILWTVHNLISHEPSNIKIELKIRKAVALISNVIIAHCNFAKEQIVALWNVNEKKVTVIPHGSYAGYYQDTVSREEARKKLGIAGDSFTFLFFGMLRNYKGVGPLVEAFKSVKAEHPEVRLIIAGKPFDERIKRHIEETAVDDQISLHLKFISDDEIQYFFNSADVAVLPYQNILTSGAAILSISFKLPFVVPAKGCMPELAANGIGITYKNDKELSSAMLNAIYRYKHVDKKLFDETCDQLTWSNLVKRNYLNALKVG